MIEKFQGIEQKNYTNPYTFKKGDTTFSILNGILKEESKGLNFSKFKNMLNKLLLHSKYSKDFSSIKPGDKVEILIDDPTQIQVILTKSNKNTTYLLNIANKSIILIPDNKEFGQNTKQEVNHLKNSISKKENLNKELYQIKNYIEKILNENELLDETQINKLNNYKIILNSDKYKDNLKANEYKKIINVLTLSGALSEKEIIKTISEVYEDKKIHMYTKIKLANYLKNNFLGFLTEKIKNGYILDPGKCEKVSKELSKKFPKYKFDEFKFVSDPE